MRKSAVICLILFNSCSTTDWKKIEESKGPITANKVSSPMEFQMANFYVKLKSCSSKSVTKLVRDDSYHPEEGKIYLLKGLSFPEGPKHSFKATQKEGRWAYKLYRADFKFDKNCTTRIDTVVGLFTGDTYKKLLACESIDKCEKSITDAKRRIKSFLRILDPEIKILDISARNLYYFKWNERVK